MLPLPSLLSVVKLQTPACQRDLAIIDGCAVHGVFVSGAAAKVILDLASEFPVTGRCNMVIEYIPTLSRKHRAL